MRHLSALFALAALLVCAQTARAAGVYFETTLSPEYASTNRGSQAGNPPQLGGIVNGATLNSESGISYDLRSTLGLKFWEKMVVGFTYGYARSPSSRDASAGANDSLERTLSRHEYGPTVGFTTGNLRFLFTYFLGGTEKLIEKGFLADGTPTRDFSLKNYLRNGMQFVVGYSFNITSSIQIGPSLAYRTVKYKEQDAFNALDPDPSVNYTAQPFTTDAKESDLLPMISLVFNF
jgi:hypothetical protein